MNNMHKYVCAKSFAKVSNINMFRVVFGLDRFVNYCLKETFLPFVMSTYQLLKPSASHDQADDEQAVSETTTEACFMS